MLSKKLAIGILILASTAVAASQTQLTGLGFGAPQVFTNPSSSVGNPKQGDLVWYDSNGGGTAGQLYGYNGSAWNAVGSSSSTSGSNQLNNLSVAASVSANALTLALKDQTGADPTSGSVVTIGFRNATATTGTYNQRNVTAALSFTVNSGSTLGMTNGVASYLYVYALDNAGTVELAIANGMVDEGSLQTTTAEGGGTATSSNVLYSATARTSVPVRLIGRINISEATAGTWASAPTEVSVSPFFSSNYIESKSTTVTGWAAGASGAWGDFTSITVPPGVWQISGFVVSDNNGATTAGSENIGISTTSGNSSSGLNYGENRAIMTNGGTNGQLWSLVIPSYVVNVSSSTTYYLKGSYGSVTTNLQQWGYQIQARRLK